MAKRRMFSKQIIDSDAFLDLPLSTQALYFHLSMRADDDGFLNNSKKIMRMIGAGKNELDLLVAKRFVLQFEDGICVIRHWRVHNYIQKDRYQETFFKQEKAMLSCTDGIYEYNLNDCVQDGYNLDTKQVENGYITDTGCIQSVSSGKVRDRDRIEIEIGEGESERENHRFSCEQSSPSSAPNKVQCKEIADLYNQYCTSFPKLKSLSEARRKAIKARLNSGYDLDDFEKLFKLAEESSFLKGKNDRDWRATFDWLIKDSNMAKVLDGNYSDKPGKKNGNNNSFFNFEQRDTDYDALVRDYYTQAF